MFEIRPLQKSDFNKNYLFLLQQLTTIDPNKITSNDFNTFIDNLHNNHLIYVIEHSELNIIIGTLTILFENKLIHNLGIVCHIEDLVIDTNFRGLKLSKLLLDYAKQIALQRGCYKIILNCANHNIPVYTSSGFKPNGNQMSMYLDYNNQI